MSSRTHQPTGHSCHSCLLREKKTDSVKTSTSLRRCDFLGGLGALALAPNAVAAMARAITDFRHGNQSCENTGDRSRSIT